MKRMKSFIPIGQFINESDAMVLGVTAEDVDKLKRVREIPKDDRPKFTPTIYRYIKEEPMKGVPEFITLEDVDWDKLKSYTFPLTMKVDTKEVEVDGRVYHRYYLVVA